MKTVGVPALLVSLVLSLAAQQFKFNLEQLESKASNSVDVNLKGSTLQFAAKFLDSNDPDEAKVKKLIQGIDGIYVKNLEFKYEGVWTKADLDAIKNQLREPDWTRILGFKSTEDGETAEVYIRNENKKITGVAIIAADPTSLTVVNIAGPVDLDSLADLSGHFGLPKLEQAPHPRPKNKD